jgi:Glycosyltransferase 61
MLSVQPSLSLVRRLIRLPAKPLREVADRTWEIHPAEETTRPRAFFLPGQLDRILGFSPFSAGRKEEERLLCGEPRGVHAATRAFLFKDAILQDGRVYAHGSVDCVQDPAHRWPSVRVHASHAQGALYSSYAGNRYFGIWLMNDLITYRLAVEHGTPVCTSRPMSAHAKSYEALLGMQPLRVSSGHFRELIVFDDLGQNQSARERFGQNRAALLLGTKPTRHPGVFLLRRNSGERRLLVNEEQIAHRLERQRGLRVIDCMSVDVPTLLQKTAGADVVISVEGSQIAHAMLVLEPGRSLLTLQPPNRFCSLFKDLTDRDGQHFGFVMGRPEGNDFRVDPDEVERTLDLLPSVAGGTSPADSCSRPAQFRA